MKANATALQGALALAGLVAAYTAWQRPAENKTEAEVTVLDASKSSLEKVRYEDGDRFMELTREDGRVWLTQGWMEGRSPPPPPPDAGTRADAGAADGGMADAGTSDSGAADAGTPPREVKMVAAKPIPPKTVRGNERADKLWERFTPLDAVRSLGVLSQDKLKELGLFDTKRKLTVTVSGTAHAYAVGNPSLNIVGMYLRDEKDGTVFLLPASLLSELEPSSQALVDRRLHAFRMNEYDAFTLSMGGQKKEFVSSNADIPQTAKVAPRETPDKPDELVRNWSDKVFNRLIVTEVLGKGETPTQGEPQVEMRVDYTSHGSPKGWVEIGKVGALVFGRSENTPGWVGLHTGTDDVLAEGKRIVGAK